LIDQLSDLNSGFTNDSLNRHFYFDRPISGLNGKDFDLIDMGALETKSDLAKAYVDMSDTDATKDMLEKGIVEQKKIAQALLNELE